MENAILKVAGSPFGVLIAMVCGIPLYAVLLMLLLGRKTRNDASAE